MIKRYKFKRYKNLKSVIVKIIIFIVIIYFGMIAGSVGGNYIYYNDHNIVKQVDVGRFKDTLNSSIPLIDKVYNSGKISSTFSGEIKRLIKSIFVFDLSSPATILDAQSPIFYSYHSNNYQPFIAKATKDERENELSSSQQDPTTNDVDDTEDSNLNNSAGDNKQDEGSKELENNDVGQQLLQDASSITFEGEERDLDNSGIVSNGIVKIQNETKLKVDINEFTNKSLKINLDKKGPKVLIFHTHTTESYIKDLTELTNKDIPNRSTDERYNVVRVGEELAQNLRKKYNIEVIHNGTIHDQPDYNSSYAKSFKTVEQILRSYPSIKVVLDIHRDGAGDGKLRTVTKVGDKNAAQCMFVVGTSAYGLSHPDWKENLNLAVKIQEKLNSKYPGLTKPIYISKYRYNQHLSTGALIIEVGGDGNTLDEAIESTKYLAEAINKVLEDIK